MNEVLMHRIYPETYKGGTAFVCIQTGIKKYTVKVARAERFNEQAIINHVLNFGCVVEESVAQAVFAHLFDSWEYDGVQDVIKMQVSIDSAALPDLESTNAGA